MPVSRHLPPAQLIAAGEGTLSAEGRAHLATCEQCSREVAKVSRLLNVMATHELETPPPHATAAVLAMLPPAAPQPSLLQRLQAVLRLDSGAGSLAYGLRGGQGKSRQLLFSAGPYEIDLRIRPDTQGWLLMGQLLGDTETGIVRLTDGQTMLVSDINMVGEFLFQAVPAGTYTLIVAIEDTELEISHVELE
jgi:hypothetical protein